MAGELPEEQAEARLKGCNRIAGILGSILLGFMVLVLLFSNRISAQLLVGWAYEAGRLSEQIGSHWRGVVAPVGYLAGIVVVVNLLLGILRSKGFAARWKGRHVVVLAALLFFGGAAAITVAGVVRELVWIREAPTLEEKRGGDRHLSTVLNDGRVLAMGINAFKEAEGRYPETLEELGKSPHRNVIDYGMELGDVNALRWQEGRTGSVAESYVYLKPAADRPADEKVPMLVSPVVVKHGRMVVFDTDGVGRAVKPEELDQILTEAGIGSVHE